MTHRNIKTAKTLPAIQTNSTLVPRYVDSDRFFSDWFGEIDVHEVINPGSDDWRLSGHHRRLGHCIATWRDGSKNLRGVVLLASQI